jgi:hypothetical protein
MEARPFLVVVVGSGKMKTLLRVVIMLVGCALIAACLMAVYKRLTTDYDGPRVGSFSIVEH